MVVPAPWGVYPMWELLNSCDRQVQDGHRCVVTRAKKEQSVLRLTFLFLLARRRQCSRFRREERPYEGRRRCSQKFIGLLRAFKRLVRSWRIATDATDKAICSGIDIQFTQFVWLLLTTSG